MKRDEPERTPEPRVLWRCPKCGNNFEDEGVPEMPAGTTVIELVCARCTDKKATFYDYVFKRK
jgi:hypothetical protein